MNEYVDRLFKQFAQSLGVEKLDFNSDAIQFLFRQWLSQTWYRCEKYKEFLASNKVLYNNRKVAEIGKGVLDTIAVNTNMMVISPCASLSQIIRKNNFYPLDFEVDEKGIPTSLMDLGGGNMQRMPYYNDEIELFMTHNPYDVSELNNWGKLSRNHQGIVVGAFGSVFDHDFDEKISSLREFKKTIEMPSKEQWLVDGTSYYYCVLSQPPTLKLKNN